MKITPKILILIFPLLSSDLTAQSYTFGEVQDLKNKNISWRKNHAYKFDWISNKPFTPSSQDLDIFKKVWNYNQYYIDPFGKRRYKKTRETYRIVTYKSGSYKYVYVEETATPRASNRLKKWYYKTEIILGYVPFIEPKPPVIVQKPLVGKLILPAFILQRKPTVLTLKAEF